MEQLNSGGSRTFRWSAALSSRKADKMVDLAAPGLAVEVVQEAGEDAGSENYLGILDRRHFTTQVRFYLNVICSVLLSAGLLLLSIGIAKGIEVVATLLWDKESGEVPPLDVSVLVTGSGGIGALAIIALQVIDLVVMVKRAVRVGIEQ